MRAFRTLSPWVLSTLLLAACGGSDPSVPGSGSPSGAPTTAGAFTAVVSFGDSLSDVGSYAPATSLAGNGTAPFFGGKFTTNDTTTGAPTATPLGKVWVENLAASLGLIVTPAEVGFAGTSVLCPAAAVPALAGTCTAYGQGGARVTDPNGIGHSGGALTVPVVTQIANHLTRFGSFTSNDLILVYAGNNDVFTQFGTFAAAAAQIQANAAAGVITPDQANLQLFAAQTAGNEAMKAAAQELVALIKTQILGKGGKYVAVMTLSDIADTPFGNSAQVAPARSVLTAFSQTFNLWLRDGLTGQPVQIIDTFALFKDGYQNPGKFGIVNNTTPACDIAKIQAITGGAVTDGTSLFCNATPGAPYNGLTTGADVNTWQFADSVHPTTGGHKIISDTFAAQLHAFGWI
ncbi:MAG: SGNH/GDSL hydrolase family protein [Burkholderiales bacterium]|nr:SGNH/GDSL hydrolase family protein [Burkholderiales bacterium]